MADGIVLLGANSYQEKYYFNPLFDELPQDIKDELKIMSVLFTEKCGGIFTMSFMSDGTLTIQTAAGDYDFYYDEIEARLCVQELQDEKKELFGQLELYYKIKFLNEGWEELSEASGIPVEELKNGEKHDA